MAHRIFLIVVGVAALIAGGAVWYLVPDPDGTRSRSTLPGKSGDTRITYRYEDGPEDCTATSAPVFTHDITDLSRITRIIPPAGVQERGELKTHSYLHNQSGAMVPVYAPADGVIAWGKHAVQQNTKGVFDSALGDEYALFMELDCDHYIMIDHFSDPNDTIRAALPAEPAGNTQTEFLASPITVKAGELLGQTSGTQPGGIWDFGVYDRRKKNVFPPAVRDVSRRDEQGVCPYDFYGGGRRESYRRLYDKNYANYTRVLELCT